MDFLLSADSAGDKLVAMVVAILLFVAVMGVLLFAVDRPEERAVLGGVPGLRRPGRRCCCCTASSARRSSPSTSRSSTGRSENFVGFDNFVTLVTSNDLQTRAA